MTPIQYFLLVGTSIYVVDTADNARLLCVCPNDDQAEWTLDALVNYHHKPHRTWPLDTLDTQIYSEVLHDI